MRKLNALFLVAFILGCMDSGDVDEGTPGPVPGFIDLKIGSTWNFEITDYNIFNEMDSVRRGIRLLKMDPGAGETSYVFEVNDTVYTNRPFRQSDPARLDTLYTRMDTAEFRPSFGLPAGPRATVNEMSFFPPKAIDLDSQITIAGLYDAKVGDTVRINGAEYVSAAFFQRTDRLHGTDKTVYLRGIGLYERQYDWSGGVTAQYLTFKLIAHNGKSMR